MSHSDVMRPPLLYHYTSLEGLRGIIESKCLWATDVEYLNDKKELLHAFGIADRLLKKSKYGSLDDPYSIRSYWRHFYRNRDRSALVLDTRTVIVSFSENGDQLSQWRGYCPSGLGVSIGFTSSLFEEHCADSRARFARCEYNSDTKNGFIQKYIDVCHSELMRKGASQEEKMAALSSFYTNILFTGAFMKDEAFQEENEWRFHIVQLASRGEWQFRTSPMGLIPFTKVPLFGDKLPIAEVIASPTLNSKSQVSAVRRYLEANHGKHISVKPSTIPYRHR